MLVKVLYDFEAQPDSSEISIQAGEYLTVTRKDVGEGWWEGRNSQGQIGLFPAGYVVEENPSVTEPEYINSTQEKTITNNITHNQQQGLYAPHSQTFPPPPSGVEFYDEGDRDGDEWDDDWDDDDDLPTQAGSEYSSGSVTGYTSGISVPQMHGGHLLTPTHNSSISTLNTSGSAVSGIKFSTTPVRKSYNRFSTFVKSGGEDYILGKKNKQAPSDSLITIVQDSNGRIMWAPIEHPYTCTISSFKKESKLKGLKSYIAYQLTPTFNNIQVSRRYKQFDWLHARMEDKFLTIPLPSLPDKQISGRYQECFIEHRMRQLRLWVNRICRHPVLSQSDVWMHFLTCTDKNRWKNGKRRAEEDEFKNAFFFFTIQAPNVPLETNFVEKKTEHFNKFIIKMDESVKYLFSVAQDECRKYLTNYKREVLKVAGGFRQLASAFEISGQEERGLLEAIKHTGFAYENIGKLYEEQPVQDFEPMSDTLHEYKGLLASWPEILEIHRGALSNKKEHQKLQDEGKIESKVGEAVSLRTDQISYAVLAEINHFQTERIHDFKQMMAAFLQQQILFYEKIVNELKDSLQKYEYA